jgi:5-methylcytosine-specific restriction endonuclease McrA
VSKLDARLAAHPLNRKPYNQLEFVNLDHNRVPLYRVAGRSEAPCGAKEALGRAFALYGGQCFYCHVKFSPQPLSVQGPHRDHVVAESAGGSNLLHNFVIACHHCGRAKSHDPIHDFQPRAAKAYFEALTAHIANCIREGG